MPNSCRDFPASILLTGATGFVGKVVLHKLLHAAAPPACIYVLLRGKGGKSAEARWEQIVASPIFMGMQSVLRHVAVPVEANLSATRCALGTQAFARICDNVTHVIHCAASVDFDLPLPQASESNITATLEVLGVARQCPKLVRMVSVSTAYVTPHHDGVIKESLVPLPRPAHALYQEAAKGAADKATLLRQTGHPNTYTLTKCIAEHLLMERRGDVPLTIVRPSIISASVAEPFAGWIDSHAALAGFVSLIGSGYMRVVHADRRTCLDVIPVDEVAQRVCKAAFAPGAPPAGIVHAVAGIAKTCRIGRWIDGIEAYYRRYPVAAPPRVFHTGGDSRGYRIRHFLHHVLPAKATQLAARVGHKPALGRGARRLLQKLEMVNGVFPYFTHQSFDFEVSDPLPPSFAPNDYVETCCAGVAKHLLRVIPDEVSLGGATAKRQPSDLWWAATQPHGNPVIRLCGATLAKALRKIFDEVTFDQAAFERARAEVGDVPVVLVPTHRSYMDFLVCSYLLFARPHLGFRVPHIAAAQEFSEIKLVGWLFRRMQAFYIARGKGGPDPQLQGQIAALVDAGATLQFFIEGQRSRARLFLAPHRGIMRCLQNTGKTFALVPVTISYDRVPEELAFLRELRGYPKDRMQLRALLQWSRRMLRGEVHLGRMHVACGTPVALAPDGDVHAVAGKVMAGLQACSTISDFHVRSFVQAQAKDSIDEAWLRRAIDARGGKILRSQMRLSPGSTLDTTLSRTMTNQWSYLFVDEACRAQPQNLALAHHRAQILYGEGRRGSPLPTAASTDAQQLSMLLQKLFAPVCEDYQAAGRSAQRYVGKKQNVPTDAWLRHTTYHDFTTARVALQALCDAKLVRRVDRFHHQVTGSFAQLDAFIAECAWRPARVTRGSRRPHIRAVGAT